jgi:3-oxoacyl-[acyl-carrier-protein] synthase-1/3-oxoacyl-[acyl-carrier-protein] synthase II
VAAAIVAFGAVSALGEERAAFDVGGAGEPARSAWSERGGGKPFGRAISCRSPRPERPRALLELGLRQVAQQLTRRNAEWRRVRVGLIVGTSSGGFAALERALAGSAEYDAANWPRSAYFAPLVGAGECLGCEPVRLVSLYAACASSTLAIGLGLRWLELDEVDLVIAGGYDAESDLVCAGFDALKATSRGMPRPFRAERDGMALGEGVALLALEREAVDALGGVSGFGATTDAVHITAPDRSGRSLARAAQLALADARLTPSEVDFVSVHGTGTPFNDAAEAAALSTVFGAEAAEKVLHAFKASAGHTLGAAGALEALSALSALGRGVLPASASPGTPMPELSARLLHVNTPGPTQRCLKLSTAFGGANAALVLSRLREPHRARARRPAYLLAAGTPCRELDVAQLRELLVTSPERLPRSDALSALAVAAAAEALRAGAAAGLVCERSRLGVIVGSVSSTLEAGSDFAARAHERGLEHAEPRRFPATSPNASAGHVAIAFGLGGPSHAVGSGLEAFCEALEVARDWLGAGDADQVMVVAVEADGGAAGPALEALGLVAPARGGFAALVGVQPGGPLLDAALLATARRVARAPQNLGFRGLHAFCTAAGLPGPGAFGSVPAPE